MEGLEFSRKIISEGAFGQPEGERTHTISFTDGYMRDNSPTFFGCPPRVDPYELRGQEIWLLDEDKTEEWEKTAYVFDGEKVIYNGSVMTKQ